MPRPGSGHSFVESERGMSGLIGAMQTALTGLQGFETGIAAVSGNLANQTTPGYAVETVNLSTAIGTGGAGAGVQAPDVTRAADGFAAGLLRNANSAAQAAGTQASGLTSISNSLQNNGDIQSVINQFFLDVGTLAASPTSTAQQQTILSDAQNVAGSFQTASASITGVMNGATAGLQQNVATANNLLSQLAVINKGLAATPNNPALLDQQEAALHSLSSQLAVNVLPQPNGQILVSTGGTVLLDQAGAQLLNLTGGTVGIPPVITAGKSTIALAVGQSDGNIGGNIQTWAQGAQALQALNARASIFSAAINQSQAQGLTTSGGIGAALFAVPGPSAAALATNTGTATLTAQIANAGQLPSDGGPFLISYSAAAGWAATDQASQQNYALGSGPNLAFAGLAVTVAGTPASGDNFLINPAPGAAAGLAVTATSGKAIASADPYVLSPGALQSDGSVLNGNAGVLNAGADIVANTPSSSAAVVPAAYYGQSLQVTFSSATAYSIATAASPGSVIASGSLSAGTASIAIAYPAGLAQGQYWQVPISGTASAGDVLTIAPGGSASGSNAARMAALWTAPGTTTDGNLQQSVVGLGTQLGANASQAQQVSTAASSQVTSASNNLQSISGVSLDQQAVVMTSYSQAYQAAAQVISTAHTMFESLLQAI